MPNVSGILETGLYSDDLARATKFYIPPHDASGPSHFAFAIQSEDLELWTKHLESNGVQIESRVMWDRGGTSLYFRDPDNHSVELVTPGTWATY